MYHDIDDATLAQLRTDPSKAWQVTGGAILPAGPRGEDVPSFDAYPDTSIVEGVWLQDARCNDDGAAAFGDAFARREFTRPSRERTVTRALVAFGAVRGRDDCVEADPNRTIALFYRNQRCRSGRALYEEGASLIPSTFEPRCIVVLLATESRAALRDEFLRVNRMLVYPLKLNVTYVLATSAEPDLVSTSTSCALGGLLHETHLADGAGQDRRNALLDAQASLVAARRQFRVFEEVFNGLPQFLPPAPPRPPDSGSESLSARLEVLRSAVATAETDVATADAALGVCQNTPEAPCGRPTALAPNPWMGIDVLKDPEGEPEPCFGFFTREATEGAYCGYWGAKDVNVDAADSSKASQLLELDGAPFCHACSDPVSCKNPRTLRCAVTAARTQRAGVWELSEWARRDRSYCASPIFKRVELNNATADESACRATMYERMAGCDHGICPQCVSKCIVPSARAVAGALRCLDGTRHLGFLHFSYTSDAGQLARSLHGAVRSKGIKAVPEKLASHLYRIAHHNPEGFVQRDAISCRAQHRNSPAARFVAGFDDEGSPKGRSGYHVPCRTNTDCAVCGRHPLTGSFYVCQTRYRLYDTVVTRAGGEADLVNLTDARTDAFDIDLERAAITNKTGICVDLDSSMNEGCGDETAAFVKDGLVGCTDNFYSRFMCGQKVEIQHGDLSTARITGNSLIESIGGVLVPTTHTLIAATPDADGDGRAGDEVKCTGSIDCTQKCLLLERTSRHGMGAPPTCAL